MELKLKFIRVGKIIDVQLNISFICVYIHFKVFGRIITSMNFQLFDRS